MNLRTPRRQISPRTKRRYQAIKNFLRRLLGFSSQTHIYKNSSLESISDLKQKIVEIEHQLNTISKHCQDLVSLEHNLKPHTTSTVSIKDQNNVESDTGTYIKTAKEPETNVIYKSLQSTNQNLRSKSKATIHDDDIKTRSKCKMINENNELYKKKKRHKHRKLDPVQEDIQTIRKHIDHAAENAFNYDTAGLYSSYSSFHDKTAVPQDAEYSKIHHHKKNKNIHEINYCFTKENNPRIFEEKWRSQRNSKHMHSELDQDFIADIIRRQYRPVKLFSKRPSDISKFSAPVCRDQEFYTPGTVKKSSKMCSCCHEKYKRLEHSKYMCRHDLREMRSDCDTRLFNSRRHKHRINHKNQLEDYNDSVMYDIIPVKEKSSPKSKRKFVKDNILNSTKHIEVPPSPRTHRPRLNLQAQFYAEYDKDNLHVENQPRCKIKPVSPVQNYSNVSNISSEEFVKNKNRKRTINDLKAISSQNTVVAGEVPNVDTTLNTQTTDTSDDKTDKTLNEIKEILQSFLLELKKESLHNEKLNIPPSDVQKNHKDTQKVKNRNKATNSSNNTFGHSMSPFMQYFTNPCCYLIPPICPMNCMQNCFEVQKPCCSCTACANNLKDRQCSNNDNKNENKATETANTETRKLINELHKLITQNPYTVQKEDLKRCTGTKVLVSRSVGGSSKVSKHDAKVGTMMKCYSKSCEDIGSTLNMNSCAANISYSDTLFEKRSSEASTIRSAFESDYSSESTVLLKKKGNRFINILKSLGLLKKKKTMATKKLSESDHSTEIQGHQARPPFEQHILCYNMHSQKYDQPHSIPLGHGNKHQHKYCNYSCCPVICPRADIMENCQGRYKPKHCVHPRCLSPNTLHNSNFCDPHSNVPLQIPLCLKEIEVKSVGTQSVRKMSFLQKLRNKVQAQKMNHIPQQNSGVLTKDELEKAICDLKKWQEKSKNKTSSDPLKFSYKTQKELVENDIKMRNAMLKKLFYKRNPFSPRNLLVRTLIGKNKSSFGEPPKMYKPRMFL